MLFAAFLVCVEAIRMELAANSNVARRLISPLNSDDGAAKRPAAQDVPW